MTEIANNEARRRFRGPSMFSSLHNRNYFLYWIGSLAFFVGMQIQMVAQGWLVLDLTNSPFYLGLIGAASSVPILLLSLFGGVTADRVDRRNLLVITQAIMLIPILATAVLITANVITVWHLLALSVIGGATAAFNMPARQAYMADLVERDELMNAVALGSAGMNMTRVLGPSMGGILIALIGVAGAYYINGGTFSIVIATLLMIPARGATGHTNGQNMLKNIGEGFRYVRDDKIMLHLLLIAALLGIFGMSYMLLLPVFARDVFGTGADGLGFLMAAGGAGALAGSLVVASLGNIRRKGWIMIVSGLFFGASLIAFALSTSFLVSLALQLVVGATSTVVMAVNNTIVQTIVPNELRGRVMSILMLTFGLMPLGGLLSGAVASWAGAPLAVALNGGIAMMAPILIALISPAIRNLD